MNFITGLLVLTYSKDESYKSIVVIVNLFTKIFYYELVNVIINISGLAKVIINILVYYYDISKSIVID